MAMSKADPLAQIAFLNLQGDPPDRTGCGQLRSEPFPGPDGPEISSRLMTDGLPSLEPHGILDGHHALDTARDADGLVNIFLRVDEAAQLHNALESFDVNLRRF